MLTDWKGNRGWVIGVILAYVKPIGLGVELINQHVWRTRFLWSKKGHKFDFYRELIIMINYEGVSMA